MQDRRRLVADYITCRAGSNSQARNRADGSLIATGPCGLKWLPAEGESEARGLEPQAREICNADWGSVVYKTMRRGLTQILLMTFLAAGCLAEDTAVDIVMKAFHADDANEKIARSYTFHEL